MYPQNRPWKMRVPCQRTKEFVIFESIAKFPPVCSKSHSFSAAWKRACSQQEDYTLLSPLTVTGKLTLFCFFPELVLIIYIFLWIHAFLSKCLPIFAYVCPYYLSSSLSVFVDTTPFSFLILFTNDFSLFLIHPAGQGFSNLTFWIRWLLALRAVLGTVGWLAASLALTYCRPVVLSTSGCISNCSTSARFVKCPLGKKGWGEGSKTALSCKPPI